MNLETEDNTAIPSEGKLQKILVGALPALAAAGVVLSEPYLTTWIQGREAALPVVMLVMICAMLHSQLRRMLIISLCYGVSFLALRDTRHIQPLPDFINYEFIEEARPASLLLISALAAFAAVSETLEPGSLRARRCYFGAATLYFSGLGIIACGWRISWQAVMLLLTGFSAGLAFIFAPRIVTEETEPEPVVEESDEDTQRAREAAHRRALRAKEWSDTFAGDPKTR